MSGRRTSGSSRPSLGVQVLAVFSFIFLGKIAVQEMSGRTPGSPRHPSCRHPRPSDFFPPMKFSFFELFSLLFQGLEGFARKKSMFFFLWFALPFPLPPQKKRKGRTGNFDGAVRP